MTLPNLVLGPIAAEFGEDFLLAAPKKKKKEEPPATCGGVSCTSTKAPKGTTDTCPAKPKKARAQDFQPLVPGWSEPPAARV